MTCAAARRWPCRPGGGRSLLGAVIALALLTAAAPSAAQAKSSCPTYLLIGARGSGDPQAKDRGLGGPVNAFATTLQAYLGKRLKVEDVHYAAVSVFSKHWRDILNGVGAYAKLPKVGAYHDSVVAGKRALRARLIEISSRCPATGIYLGGYSQGAQVVGDVVQGKASKPLPGALFGQIQAVVLFGDPYFNNSQRSGDELRDEQLASNGLLGTRPAWTKGKGVPSWFTSRIFSFCHRTDPVCQHGALSFTAHSYTKTGEPQMVGEFYGQLSRIDPTEFISGFYVDLAGVTHVECHSYRDGELPSDPSHLACDIAGTAPPNDCPEAAVPAFAMNEQGGVDTAVSFQCEGPSTFHGWLGLPLGWAWTADRFTCRRSAGALLGRGEFVHCLAPGGRGGFIVDQSGVVTIDGA